MKKSLVFKIFIFIFILGINIFFGTKDVFADSYPLTCSLLEFEVSKINDDGTFSKVACYDDFTSAHNKMKENEDYVVRNNKSLSPTKIVDMNSGVVYTYPYRANSLTQKVYQGVDQNKNGTGVTTYLTIHYPMAYLGNENYNEYYGYSGGWVHVDCHGFNGYADLEYVDFVPTKYLKNGIAITLGGNDKTTRNEQPFKVVCKPNTYEAVKNGNYTDLVFTFYRGWSEDTNGGVGIHSSSAIGVAPSFMELGKKYYSSDGVNFYSDIELKNLVGTYYNYYQFVPFRTKSNISANVLDSYLNSHCNNPSSSAMYGKGNEFKSGESKYGCNATLIFSFAIHESGWGKSALSYSPYNNLFGYNAVDSDVSKAYQYNSISDCIISQMGDNLANYMDVNCSTYFSMSLGNKGGGFMTKYASDPYWAEKIAHYYYDIDKYANNNNGNLTDYNSYNIALVNSYNVAVKKDASSGSRTYYNTANKNGYQKNLVVVTLEDVNDYTKTQLSNPIDENYNVVHAIEHPKGTNELYDFNRSVGYIPKSALTPLNFAKANPNPNPEPQGPKNPDPSKMEPMVAVDQFNLEGNTITLKGAGVITYSNFDDLSKIKHEFVIKNLETDNEATFDLTSEEYPGFGLNDGYDYKYVGFSGSVDLSNINNGTYKIIIRITNGEYVKEKEIRNSNFRFYNMTSKVGDLTNKITSNPRYSYRLELEISESPLDYSSINIVDNRPSLFAFDNITINDSLDLHVDGQAFIYYTNYDNAEDVTYKVYLIKDSNNYKELNTNRKTCSINYSEALNSSYDLTNICYEVDDNISDLEDGEYKMIMEIKKVDGDKTYIDYVEMTNIAGRALPSVTKDNAIYEIIKQNTRDRMIVKVGANNEE